MCKSSDAVLFSPMPRRFGQHIDDGHSYIIRKTFIGSKLLLRYYLRTFHCRPEILPYVYMCEVRDEFIICYGRVNSLHGSDYFDNETNFYEQ